MIYLIHIMVFAFEAYIAWQFQSSLLQEKKERSRIKYFAVYLGGFTLAMCAFLSKITWLNLLVLFLVHFLIAMYFYHGTISKLLLLTLIQISFMALGEMLVAVYGNHFYQITNGKDTLLSYAFHAIGSKLLYWFIIRFLLICIKGTRDKRNFGNTSNFYEYGLCLVPLGSIIIFGSVLDVLWLTEVSFWQEARIVLCAAVLVCMNVLIFWIYDRHQQMMININNLQLRLQGEEADNKYYHMLNKQNEDMRILRHDIKNHLLAIKGYIVEGKTHDGEIYIDELLQSKGLLTPKRWCHDPLLNTIIQRYYDICRAHAVNFSADIRLNSTEFLQPMDVVAIFGNLLDNASSAASMCEDGYVEIDCRVDEKKHESHIQIINTCSQDPVSDGKGQWSTTKQDKGKHGYGLKSVENAITHYNGFLKTFYQQNDKTFHVFIILHIITGGGSYSEYCDM